MSSQMFWAWCFFVLNIAMILLLCALAVELIRGAWGWIAERLKQ